MPTRALPPAPHDLPLTGADPAPGTRSPQTNIKTEPYTIGGVDPSKPDIALVTPAQVTRGRYFTSGSGREALVAPSYAAKHGLKVGSTLTLNGKAFRVVGIVQPPLGGQTADV